MSASTGAAAREGYISSVAVRGVAVVGVGVLNVVGMGLPAFAYLDPTYAGGSTGADLWTWAVNNVLTDGKMRALFTMLFGASAVLIAERAEGGRPGPMQTHYRRMFWLFAFGMIHAYFLWWGDILVTYSLAGLVIFPFRKLTVRTQVIIGVVILSGLLVANLLVANELDALYAAAKAPGASPAAISAWQEASQLVAPSQALKLQELAGYRGGFMDALRVRALAARLIQTYLMPTSEIPEAIGQMFLGMALFRSGFFTLTWSTRRYRAAIAICYLLAAPASAWLAWKIQQSNFDPLVLNRLEAWQQISRPLVALAHASALLLIIRAGVAQAVVNRLSAAGRMAFSNYLMTSIITTLLFDGFGFGLYGRLSRFDELAVVAGVWVFILAWSKPWLARFHYGPFEWAWRSLVRWSPQPFLRVAPPAPATA
jgi:uncharacterized protein